MVIGKFGFFICIGTGCHAELHIRITFGKFFRGHTIIITGGKDQFAAGIHKLLQRLFFRSLCNVVFCDNLNPVAVFIFDCYLGFDKIVGVSGRSISNVQEAYFYCFLCIFF